MEVNDSTTLVVDTSVLINFLCIDRMDLIPRHSHSFIVTEHVAEEVKNYYSDERTRLDNAFKSAILREERVEAPSLATSPASSATSERLGLGERSAIALAIAKGWQLAIDDRRAAREALEISPRLRIVTTQDLVVSMICENLLNIAEADDMKHAWSTRYRFHLRIESFADVVSAKMEGGSHRIVPFYE